MDQLGSDERVSWQDWRGSGKQQPAAPVQQLPLPVNQTQKNLHQIAFVGATNNHQDNGSAGAMVAARFPADNGRYAGVTIAFCSNCLQVAGGIYIYI